MFSKKFIDGEMNSFTLTALLFSSSFECPFSFAFDKLILNLWLQFQCYMSSITILYKTKPKPLKRYFMIFSLFFAVYRVEVSLASLLLPIKAIFRNFQFRLFWVMHWNWELEMFFCVYFPFERMRILLSKHCIVFKWDHICLWVLPAMGCFHVGCIFCSHMCAMAYNFQWLTYCPMYIFFFYLCFCLGASASEGSM